MKLAIVGVGQAGGKILDNLIEYDRTRDTGFIGHTVAVNTAKTDLMGLTQVPESNRLLVGQSTVSGHGTGTDPETGEECISEDIHEIMDSVGRVATSEIEAFLIIAGLGGGTGSGGSPVIADRLGKIYAEPVYGLGILPSTDEGGIYNRNAANSLQRFARSTDSLLLFDNGAAKTSGETLSEGYEEINDQIATRFGMLFSAGEIDALSDGVAESVVDSSEIINTLGEGGITTIGFASETIETDDSGGGLLDRFRGSNDGDDLQSAGDATNRITSLVRRATLGKLTLPCERDSADRVLLIVAGPPEHLSRKGIDNARDWLESETDCREVRAGDYPLPNENRVAALVMLSGVTEVPRIEEMQQLAIESDSQTEDESEFEDLLEYDEGPDASE